MKFKIKSKVELEDYIKFNFYFSRKTLIIWIIFIFLVGLIIVYSGGGFLPGGLFLFFIFFVIYILYFIIDVKRKIKRAYDSDKLIQEECEYIFDKKCFVEKTSRGETLINYSDILKVDENKNAIYIFIGENRCYIIPKRYINNDENQKIIKMISLGKNSQKKHL